MASGRELISLDGKVGNAFGRLFFCCFWPYIQRWRARRKKARLARRAARAAAVGKTAAGIETADAGTMTDARGLYLYMYRQAMQEGSLLGGRNSMATATSEPAAWMTHADESMALSWETTPAARAAPSVGGT